LEFVAPHLQAVFAILIPWRRCPGMSFKSCLTGKILGF